MFFDDKTSGRVTVPFGEIVKANLEVDMEEEFRRAKQFEALGKGAKDNGRKK